MELLSGSEMVIRFLKDYGVQYVYGYPGGALLHIYDALFKEPAITHILVRHEQAATHMADGYARVAGKPGVVLVTSGPGATNAITGIATAYADSIPMVVISGQVASPFIGTDAFQEVDMMGLSRPIVKHSFMIKDPKDIPLTMSKAFYIARTGRPGPVVIDIPKDMGDPSIKYEYQFIENPTIISYAPINKGHSGHIIKAAEMLMLANKPLIIAGGGVVLSGASEILRHISNTLNMPVVNTLMGLGTIDAYNDKFLGMLGMHGSFVSNNTTHNADLILAVGVRFDDRVVNGANVFAKNAQIIHIDIDPASITKIVKADIPIVGDAKSVLTDLLHAINQLGITKTDLQPWWQQINNWRIDGLYSYQNSEKIIKPQNAIEAVSLFTNSEAIITSDVGQHQMFIAQYYKFKNPNQWITSGGLGTMGFGLPAAMGIKVNFPEKEVICITGEGSIQMNIQELSTCLQYDIKLKIVLLNNGALGMVRQWQDMQYNSRYSHSYMQSLPDFIKLSESYGHVGIRITDPKMLNQQLKEALSMKDKLVFIDVAVDVSEHVYPMQIKDEGTNSPMNRMWLSKTERTQY